MTQCRCGSEKYGLKLTPEGPHYGKLLCDACGRFGGWAPKPRLTLEVGAPALHLGETVTVAWIKNGWVGLEGSDGRKFSSPADKVKGMPA